MTSMSPVSITAGMIPRHQNARFPEISNGSRVSSIPLQCDSKVTPILINRKHSASHKSGSQLPFSVHGGAERKPRRIFSSQKHGIIDISASHLPSVRRKHAGGGWYRHNPAEVESCDKAAVSVLRYSKADLQVSGWLGKRGQRIGSRVWRFFTLNGSVLANSHGEGTPSSWAISVRGATVSAVGSREVIVRQYGTTVSLLASSGAARARWITAIRAVSSPVLTFYDKGKLIGGGPRSELFLGRDKTRNELCVIKVLLQRSEERSLSAAREPTSLLALSHPSIVQIYDIFDAPARTHIIMEYLAGGDLLDRITTYGRLSERSARVTVRDILLGLRYLHSKGIVHRDVALEHILCVNWAPPFRVKLVGLGLSHAPLRVSDNGNRVVSAHRGSAYYMSPETTCGADPAPPADLWACGVVLYVMLAGKLPFYGETDEKFIRRISAGVQFSDGEWDVVSASAKDLIRKLLEPCINTRITAHEALQHRWLKTENDRNFSG